MNDEATAREAVFATRFEREVWPLFTRGEGKGCLNCHDAETKSELYLGTDAEGNFRMLLDHGYFSPADPDGLLGRVSSTDPKKRMPKGRLAKAWTGSEVELLRSFASEVTAQLRSSQAADERFPRGLLRPYEGKLAASGSDNQFISYWQLKGKIRTLLEDDWIREGRDLFQENIALFGGADFTERFNESTKASPTFLTGLEMLARDVVGRAYARRKGPFAARPDDLTSPVSMDQPDPPYAAAIDRLYRHLLFRPASADERQAAFELIKRVYAAETEMQKNDFELGFTLVVSDPATGLDSSESLSIPVRAGPNQLFQEFVDQSDVQKEENEPSKPEANTRRRDRRVSGLTAEKTLAGTFQLRPDDPTQVLRLFNAKTVGNVSFAGVRLRPVNSADTNAIIVLAATNRAAQAEGAWKIEERKGLTSFEDENNNKGSSSVTVRLDVPAAGPYEVTLFWRQSAENARAVLVEIASQSPGQLAVTPDPPAPPSGQANYFIDQSNDAVAFAELKARFRFGPNDYVEINNQGTRRRVTADAVQFIPQTGPTLVIDNDEADGREEWKVYDSGDFKAYNQVGKDSYHDENKRKGELRLRYRPASKPGAWQSDRFYQVKVGYPAKQDHEIHTPVVVRAEQSSPIVQVAHPLRAYVGAEVEIDAARSRTVQGSELRFRWEQTAGPAVECADWTAATLKFRVPPMKAPQAAWEGLARALLQHPDFLFTRPPSLASARSESARRMLQLVKISQDLLGRPPTPAERQQLEAGRTLAELVDDYLRTDEFKDFYYRRIRLYLESHGSEIQDEPARLWCYIAFNDRPFQEILTADYTVNARWEKQPRPAWCGRTGLLTTRGFIEGKPGLPHFNYAAQVAELFLGYIFEVPPEVVAQREGITAASTTDPASVCYSCHKMLTPLAFQRTRWDDQGRYRTHDDYGLPIDDSDQKLVASYPFAGDGLEAFARQAVKKERFVRTMINTHFTFYFGRDMRYLEDERGLYKRLWDSVHRDHFAIRPLIRTLVTSPEYLGGKVCL